MAAPPQTRHIPRSVWHGLIPLLAVACGVVATPIFGAGESVNATVDAALGTSASSVQPLRINAGRDEAITTHVVLAGQSRTLVLHPYTLRSADFRVLVQADAGGPLAAVDPPPPQTYRGTIVERPGAVVSATLANGALTAVIRDGSTIWGIQPASKLGLSATPSDHVVYRATDWTNPARHTCGTPNEPNVVRGAKTGTVGRSTGLVSAELAIDTDVEFFQLNGNSVTDTVRDVETILNAVELIYERDVEISYEVTTIVVRTIEPDPYTDTDINALFCAFRTRWNTGPESVIRRDVAHLFTGKKLNGSTVGLARLATACNTSLIDPFGCSGGNANLAYGLSQSHFTETLTARVALTAHELGHNFSATHCDGQSDCHIMCSTLSSCAGIDGPNLRFGALARNAIVNFRDTHGCLEDVLAPQTLPFVETFPSTILDPSKWSYNRGAATSQAGVAPPSEPFSLNLDAADSGPFGDDEIRSNVIALDGAQSAMCTYLTQHRGVEAGKSLIVEYQSSDLTWKLLERIDSDGVDQSVFVPSVRTLPDDARHAAFRIRFRTEVSDPDDDWYIDDVTVKETCVDDAVCQDGVFCNGTELCVNGFCQHGPAACAVAADCEEELRACRDEACLAPQILSAANRYLSILPPLGADPVAILVAPACDIGAAKFVGPPSTDHFAVLVNDTTKAARQPPVAWNGVVRVADADIVPGTNYLVWAECSAGEPRVVSSPTGIATTIWGDTVGVFENNAWTAPDNVVNVTDDVIAIVRAFQRDPSAPPLYQVDLLGNDPLVGICAPDLRIDLLDVLQAISGFQGIAYSIATSCPDPCQAG